MDGSSSTAIKMGLTLMDICDPVLDIIDHGRGVLISNSTGVWLTGAPKITHSTQLYLRNRGWASSNSQWNGMVGVMAR